MGITLTITGGGLAIGFNWGAAIGLGIACAIRALNSNNNNGQSRISSNIANSVQTTLSGIGELTQTITEINFGKKKEDNDLLLSDSSSNISLIPDLNVHSSLQEEDEKEDVKEEQDEKEETGDEKGEIGNQNAEYINIPKVDAFIPNLYEKKENNKILEEIYKETISTFSGNHINKLIMNNAKNHSYYLNQKYKKILDPISYENFRKENLLELKQIRFLNKTINHIFKGYYYCYQADNISNILSDENKKISHKIVESSSELIKEPVKAYFIKKYFLKSLKNLKHGIKRGKELYNNAKIIKGIKIASSVSTIGTGIILNVVVDEVIDIVSDLSTKAIEKGIDYLEEK